MIVTSCLPRNAQMTILAAMRNSILAHGTRVRLPDGTIALAYRDGGIGRPWSPIDGTYITAQLLHGVERRDAGWRREQLEPLPADALAR